MIVTCFEWEAVLSCAIGVDEGPCGPVLYQVSAAVCGFVEFVKLHKAYGVVVECFSVTGYRAVRTVCVCFAFVCESQICEVIICDFILICAKLGSESDQSGVDCLEALGKSDTIVLAVAVSVLAVSQADTGQELVVAGHRCDKGQVPVAVKGDVAAVERSEALDPFDAIAGAEACCCDCFDAVKSCDEVGLTFFGNALLNEAGAVYGVDQACKIVICYLIFICGKVISEIAVLFVEFSCGLRSADPVLLCVKADVALAFVDGDVVVEGVALPGSLFGLFLSCLSDLFLCFSFVILFDNFFFDDLFCCSFVILFRSFFFDDLFCCNFVILFGNLFFDDLFSFCLDILFGDCCVIIFGLFKFCCLNDLCYFFYRCSQLICRDLICEYSCRHCLEHEHQCEYCG